PQPGRIRRARDLYSGDAAAVGKVYLKVMFSLLTAAPPVDDARLPDGTLKEVANPSLVILQVLVVRQRDRYEVAHGRSIGSPSASGRTHFAADDQISIMPVERGAGVRAPVIHPGAQVVAAAGAHPPLVIPQCRDLGTREGVGDGLVHPDPQHPPSRGP